MPKKAQEKIECFNLIFHLSIRNEKLSNSAKLKKSCCTFLLDSFKPQKI